MQWRLVERAAAETATVSKRISNRRLGRYLNKRVCQGIRPIQWVLRAWRRTALGPNFRCTVTRSYPLRECRATVSPPRIRRWQSRSKRIDTCKKSRLRLLIEVAVARPTGSIAPGGRSVNSTAGQCPFRWKDRARWPTICPRIWTAHNPYVASRAALG